MFGPERNSRFAVHRDVIVLTDNTQVLHLDNWSPIGQRQRIMIHYMSQFRLTVKFVQGCKNLCADMLSRSFGDMSETDRKQFLPTAAEQSEDFILPVTITSGDEQESEDISFIDASDADDGDKCYILSGFNVVTCKQSYEPDAATSHPAQPDSSKVESNDTPRERLYSFHIVPAHSESDMPQTNSQITVLIVNILLKGHRVTVLNIRQRMEHCSYASYTSSSKLIQYATTQRAFLQVRCEVHGGPGVR